MGAESPQYPVINLDPDASSCRVASITPSSRLQTSLGADASDLVTGVVYPRLSCGYGDFALRLIGHDRFAGAGLRGVAGVSHLPVKMGPRWRRKAVPEENTDPRARQWILAALVFVVLSPVAAFAIRSASGGWLAFWVIAQVAATGVAFLIPQWRQVVASRSEATAEEREDEVRVETRVALNDALDPILRLLGNLALEQEPQRHGEFQAQAVPLVLATAAEFIGPARSRACWFKLEKGPPVSLVPTDSVGRAGSPTTTFKAGTKSGDAAIGMVLADEDRLCRDIESEPPPGWDSTKQRDYRTFVSVSVIAGDIAHGMLTLDAVEPDTLTVEDKALLRLMAGMLAVALSVP